MVIGGLFVRTPLDYVKKGSGFVGLLEKGFGRHRFAYLLGEIPLFIMWIIWRECYRYTFEGVEGLPLGLTLF